MSKKKAETTPTALEHMQDTFVFEPMRFCSAMMVNFAPTPQHRKAALAMHEGTERFISLSKALTSVK